MNACRVDVWTISLTAPRELFLSPEEQARAARFRFERDRLHWSNARSALRAILAAQLAVHPLEIHFTLGPHGKPSVEGVEFNISHSGGLAMVAVALDTPVGIDIEHIRPNVDMAKLLRRIGEPDDPAPVQELFQRWTRREAKTKALGTPLMEKPGADLRVVDLIPPEGFAASLALPGRDPEVVYRLCELNS